MNPHTSVIEASLVNDDVHATSISSSGRWSTHASSAPAHAVSARRRDGDVDVVADDEPLRTERNPVIWPFDTRLRRSDGTQLVAREPLIGVDDAELESRSFAASIMVDLLNEGGELLEGGVHPRVDLKFVGR